jgi:hypothetical protein
VTILILVFFTASFFAKVGGDAAKAIRPMLPPATDTTPFWGWPGFSRVATISMSAGSKRSVSPRKPNALLESALNVQLSQS